MADWYLNNEDVSQFMLQHAFIKSDKDFPMFENKKSLSLMCERNGDFVTMWKIEPCKFWQVEKNVSTGEENFVDDWTFYWMEFLAQKHGQNYVDYLNSCLPQLQEDYRLFQSRIMATKTEKELRNLPECILIKKLERCPNIGSTNDQDEQFEDFSGHKQRFDTKVYRYMEMKWNKVKYLEKHYSQKCDETSEM